jgi:hypothetical protein
VELLLFFNSRCNINDKINLSNGLATLRELWPVKEERVLEIREKRGKRKNSRQRD